MIWVMIIVGTIALFIYNNTKRGAEFVRAHIFLSGIEAGFSVDESNTVASVPASELPDKAIRSARIRADHEHGGKQLPIIKKAYRAGMICRLPGWQRKLLMIG